MHTWLPQTENGWLSRKLVQDADWVDVYVRGVSLVLRSPGGSIVWPIIQGFYDPRFVDEVDRVVKKESTTWLEALLP